VRRYGLDDHVARGAQPSLQQCSACGPRFRSTGRSFDISPRAALRAPQSAYAPGERTKWDLYPASDPKAPCFIHIHGGYWQRGSKEMFACLAEGALAHGWSAAPHSVRHEHGSHGGVREHVAGHPAEEQPAHAAVRIGTHDQHANPGLARLVKERVADAAREWFDWRAVGVIPCQPR
jgi:hypothetical protein